jgi:NAD(P)H-hydrate epimerase
VIQKPELNLSAGALLSTAGAQALDGEAQAQWGLNPFALVEAAGRACAEAFTRVYAREKREGLSIIVCAGKGNNAADALIMLKALILDCYAQASACAVYAAQIPESSSGDTTPLSEAMLAVQKLGVPVIAWEPEVAAAALARADVIIDGIAGTGLNGPLRGAALEMAEMINAIDRNTNEPFIVSIDLPSGNFDGWQAGMSLVKAHATLAIEPRKLCLYTPAARPYAGTIIPVTGIFPPALIDTYREAELAAWESASARIPRVSPTAYKYERGLVEIRAGSPGATGAAQLAARGAQAAGAGLVRLIVDPSLYPIIAPGCSGIMAVPGAAENSRFTPDAVLLGPGWGRGEDRMRLLESYLPLEKQGIPLILDADAIALAKDMTFNGNALLTPHPGEFAAYTGLSKDEVMSNPLPALRRCAAEKKVHILYKSHVLYAVSPDGRTGVIDGMNPALGAGGSGDVLAGFCASIAARWRGITARSADMYVCACAAASLLVQSAKTKTIAGAFFDPAELAKAAAALAGAAWLPHTC